MDPTVSSVTRTTTFGQCTVNGTMSDGKEQSLMSFYIDELSFVDSEFIGKTQREVTHMHFLKDRAYLQS